MAPDAGRADPQRRCVVCRRAAGKASMLRVVRGADGRVAADTDGRHQGRGAYVCRRQPCLRAAQLAGGLARGLRLERGMTIGAEVMTWLDGQADLASETAKGLGVGR